jgi:hypothetical protein
MEPNENSINFPNTLLFDSQPPSMHQPNFITNADNDLSHDQSNTVEPTIRTQTNVRSKVTQVMASDLRNFVKSKEDLYVILCIEGQLHLPPYDECTMDFMRDALSGKKRLITNRELAMVNVPRYKEFNAVNLYKAAMADADLRIFLPEVTSEKSSKVINRKFLFNVSDTWPPIAYLLGDQHSQARFLPTRNLESFEGKEVEAGPHSEPLH